MKEQLARWLSTLAADVRQGIVGYVAVAVVLALVAGLSLAVLFVRSTVDEFLTADLKVWHGLVTLAVTVLCVTVAVVVGRRLRPPREAWRASLAYESSPFRRSIDWSGVRWRLPGGDAIHGPFCPNDETFLARYKGDGGRCSFRNKGSYFGCVA